MGPSREIQFEASDSSSWEALQMAAGAEALKSDVPYAEIISQTLVAGGLKSRPSISIRLIIFTSLFSLSFQDPPQHSMTCWGVVVFA